MKGKLRVYYDEEGDYLEIRIGDPRSNFGEEINDDITVFKDTETEEIVGMGILNFKEKTNLNNLEVELPFDIGLFARTN
ncbi:hypothetical protein CMI42_01070 [Candidatus Pacearchaeota archaeon]|nr:hypothetical protein [Candidatus Pacearchaeota archaeon]|tara:strand:+ start:299 stop:535 length:237 start_codon:yes stop_codon:yes gene_type:complete